MSHIVPHHLESLHRSGKTSLNSIDLRFKSGDIYSAKSSYRKSISKSEEPIIPAPSLFSTLTTPAPQDGKESTTTENGDTTLLDMPTVGECAVHLELLEVFFALRHRIVNSEALDKTFAVEDQPKTVYRRTYNNKTYSYETTKHTIKDTTWTRRRREKWLHYLHVAVGRFMYWAPLADSAISRESKSPSSTTLVHIPPLDILMVWHAFLLNPGDYKKFCHQKKLQCLYRASFPWERIHEAIDHRTLTYTLPSSAAAWAELFASMSPNLYDFLASPSLPEPIATALAKYGDTSSVHLWRQRPNLQLGSDTKHLGSIERGFIHTFQTATGDRTQAESLVANVQRQASFVDKMHNHLWLRSPGVQGTVRRALERYADFLRLFKLHPGTMLVPTLDIDLAWHTHQLTPLRYVAGCEARAGRFIDHDDKIVQGRLDTGYDKTKELYQMLVGGTYAVCLCWDCEAVASALEDADEERDNLLSGLDMKALTEQAKKEVEYHRVVETARGKGKDEPLPVFRSGNTSRRVVALFP